MPSELTKLVLQAQEQRQISVQLRQQLMHFSYQYPPKKLGKYQGEDIASSFLFSVLADLERSVLRFDYRGLDFEHYLRRFLYFRLYSYLREQRFQQDYCHLGEQLLFREQHRMQTPPQCIVQHPELYYCKKLLEMKKNCLVIRKSLFVFALKYSQYIDYSPRTELCLLLRVNNRQFNHLCLKIEQLLQKKITRLQEIREQRCQNWFKFLFAGESAYKILHKPAFVKLCPTHMQLAHLLHAKKGSIDSMLFRLQQDFIRLLSEEKA